MSSQGEQTHTHDSSSESQNRSVATRLLLWSCIATLAFATVGAGAAGLTADPGVATDTVDVDSDIYTNDSLRLIAGGAPVDNSSIAGERNQTRRGPFVRSPRRPLTVDQAVRRSAVVDGYRPTLTQTVYIPVEDQWTPLTDTTPERQWVSGVGGDPLQTTAHPNKTVTVTVEEASFESNASVRDAYLRYNETTDSFRVANPNTAEVQNQSGAWIGYNRLTILNKTVTGFRPVNAATSVPRGQYVRVKTASSIGFMPVRDAYVTWAGGPVGQQTYDYDSGYSLINESRTEVYTGSYTTISAYNKDTTTAFEPAATNQSVVPQANGTDRWATGDGGTVTLQSGANHTVVRDHWTGLAYVDPGGKFDGEINGTQREFYIADPDGFEVSAPHDFRLVDPPDNNDGTTREEWTRESVDRTLTVTHGNQTASGGPHVSLNGGADGLTINSTVTVTYTRERGDVGGSLNESDTVTVRSSQEITYNLTSSVKDEVDVTVYVVDGSQNTELWYEIDGNNSIADAPVSEITVNAGSNLTHTVRLPWQFMSMLDYDAVETRQESTTSTESVSLDPTTPPWSSTTDYVAGGDISGGTASQQLRAANNTSTTAYSIALPQTVANGNHSVTVPHRFGGSAPLLSTDGSVADLETATVEAKTIYGATNGTGINNTSVQYLQYTGTNIRATYYSEDGSTEAATVQILLEDEYGIPIANRTLRVEGAEAQTVTTDADGRAAVNVTNQTVGVVFTGDQPDTDADILYERSSTTVRDSTGVTDDRDVFSSFALLVEWVVLLAPMFALAVGLGIWKLLFGSDRR